MLSKRAAFRLSVMLISVTGIVYGAARIDRLPPGPRRIVARIGQWLQQQAGDGVAGDRGEGTGGQGTGGSEESGEVVEAPAVAEIRAGTQSLPSTDFGSAIEGLESAIDAPGLFPSVSNDWPSDTQPVFPVLLPETSLAPVGPRTGRSASLAETFPSQDESSALATLASQLQSLGATDYLLEKWGEDGELFRFHCEVVVGVHPSLRRHFEAVAPTGEEAIRRVLAEVAASR